MLVLTRKLMEKLFIGDDICITVVRLEGGQVRLGIEAPRSIAVVRAELVPERKSAGPRLGPRPVAAGQGPHAPASPSGSSGPPTGNPPSDALDEVRLPPAAAHGTDNRRRGPSR